MTANVNTMRRRQLAGRARKGIAQTMEFIGQTLDRDTTRYVTDTDKSAAVRRAGREARALERDFDVLETHAAGLLRRLALGLADEEELFAELDEIDAEVAKLRRRERYWQMAARTLEDELGIVRDSVGNILR